LADVEETFSNEGNADDFTEEKRLIQYSFTMHVRGYVFASTAPGNAVPVQRYISAPTVNFEIIEGKDVHKKTEVNMSEQFTLSEIKDSQQPTTKERFVERKGNRYIQISDQNKRKGETVYTSSDSKTLAEFLSFFKDEETCRKYFEQMRFKDGDFCPHCKHDKIMRFSDGKRYRCDKCKKDFTIKTGTLFGESKIPMQKWFIAIYLLTTRKKGISSIELSEQVGVSQKTAWFMDHRIRDAFQQGKGKLSGIVEVDETYIGGKHRRSQGFKKKAPIFGMTERDGKIKAFHVPSRETHIILGQLKKHINKDKTYLMSDEAQVYKKLLKLGYQRSAVKHGKGTYVRGNVHTNSIESFWALVKRQYHGTHHTMSKKHLQRYIDEIAYRFNHRGESMADIFADAVTRVSRRGKMSYKKLTA
jgi:transposase-like protein